MSGPSTVIPTYFAFDRANVADGDLLSAVGRQRERKLRIIIGAKSLRNKVNLDVMRNKAWGKDAA